MMHIITSGTQELEKNMEVIAAKEDMAIQAVEQVLADPGEWWQPCDFLPDFHQPDAWEQVAELQKRAKGVSSEVIMSLVGNMITEEALPSYQTYFSSGALIIGTIKRASIPTSFIVRNSAAIGRHFISH